MQYLAFFATFYDNLDREADSKRKIVVGDGDRVECCDAHIYIPLNFWLFNPGTRSPLFYRYSRDGHVPGPVYRIDLSHSTASKYH